jgi:endonuclease/exonuclease/phosphatase (EEP) superfamily protein YafD
MWLRAFIVAVALALLGMWWALGENPERRPVVALLQYLPYPVYVAPALLALLVSFWLRWWWRLLAAASLALALTVLMGLCVGQPDEGHGRLRFMTYNVKAYYARARPHGFDEIGMEILQQDPDVIVMQDAVELAQLETINPPLFRAVVGDRQTYAFGQYLVASRFPLKDCKPGWVPYRMEMHSFVHCVLQAHGQEVDLVTVHFVTPRQGLNATRREGVAGLKTWSQNMNDRLSQAGLLAENMRHMTRPYRIVAGDLNAPESSAVVQTLLNTGLRDAYSSAAWGYGFTHGHSLRPGIDLLRIDHILVSGNIGVEEAHVGGKVASQHRPVIADLLMFRD